ncbi:hypothetical protein [Thauera sp. Sel9]|uniref:hypothetical protein n=1 Tax=Thauera sp. Sel9 TaxID=2974299 RepID=UPI0021E17CE7|nr:hypothetical protein [Thauera sp. Sel9]MCV2219319.1 hypothetical protein [Thauera sp. Sel9]
MKKLLLSLALGFGLAGNLMAADNAGTTIAGAVTTTDCSLLTEDVRLNLSSAVFGSYACNTTDNVIGIATCHPQGRKGNVTVACDPVDNPAAIPPYTAPDGCTVRAGGTGPNDGEMTVQGGLAFTASSAGGRVQGEAAQNCTTGGNTNAEAENAAGL